MALQILDTETGEITDAPKELERNRSKENREFIMLYRRFIQQVSDLGMEDPQALRVLLFLCRHMDSKNALAVPMSLMSDMLKVSRQTISQKIKYLSEHGWIAIFKLGRQNVYVVNPDVVWTSYADQKSYCRFDATVMLSNEDNWAILKDQRMGVRHVDMNILRAMASEQFPEESNDT